MKGSGQRRWPLLLAVVAAITAGCTTNASSSDAPSSPAGGAGGGVGGSVSETLKPGPADRDPAALMAALRQIDACKLIDQAAAAAVGYQIVSLGAPSPHHCQAFPKGSFSELDVRIGSDFELPNRFFAAPLDLAGMRGYRTDLSVEVCQVDLPVDLELSISTWVRRDAQSNEKFKACDVATAVATSAAARLAHPEQVRADPAVLVLSTWDACTLLLLPLGDHAREYRLTRGQGLFDNAMDSCAATHKDNHTLTWDFQLRIDYRKEDWTKGVYEHPSDVEGKQVVLRDDTRQGCERAWTHQPVPAFGGSWVAVIAVISRTCELEPVAQIIRAERAGPPPVQPLAQVLYRVDQPDLNYPGACVDYGGAIAGGCQPAHQVSVPTDPAQRRQAADHDPNVTCALTTDAVRARLGAGMQPVTSSSSCAWVEPTHTVSIKFRVDTTGTAQSYGGSTKTRDITIGGHPALRIDHTDDPEHQQWEVYVSTGNDLAQPGVLGAELTTYSPRGSPDGTPADTKPGGLLEPILADILSAL